MNAPAHPLGPLAPLADAPQWIVVKLPGKIPLHFITGQPCNAHERQNHAPYEAAVAMAQAWGLQTVPGGPGHTVGFVLTAADDWACIDLDKAALPDGTGWHPLAHEIAGELHGAVLEVSQSGKGLHLWCRHANPPSHTNKRTDQAVGLEAYSAGRFIAIGTQQQGTLADRCDALPAFLAKWFPPRPTTGAEISDDGPCPEWDGHTDDAALIDAARRSQSAGTVFGDGVTFSDLYDGNEDALAKRWPSSSGDRFDRSSADFSLACRLAWWSGRDVGRVARIMLKSKLARSKWDRPDYFIDRTIREACRVTTTVHTRRRPEPPAPFAASATTHATVNQPARQYSLLSDDPLQTARAFLQRDHHHPDGDRLKTWQGVTYCWGGVGWSEMTTDDVRAMLYRFLERDGFSHFVPTQSKVTNLLDALKAASHVPSRQAPPCWADGRPGPAPRELIACANGLLHLPTRALHPPTPAFFSTNAAPYNYQADAPPPAHWMAFMQQLWPGDPEPIATLQEVFGYLLTPDTSQQKLFLIVGPKRSGKGTIGRVLARLLGEDNVTSPSLSSLGADFGLQPLIGKLAAIVSDARLGGRADPKAIAENLLRLSGEDRVEVNRKHLSSITMQLAARFVLLTNELPRLADSSGAMASRFIVLKMNQSFYGKEDPGLTGRLLEELPGILNWAIEGWQRLRQRGYFVTPRSSMAEAQELADLGSPVLAFVRDVCELSPVAEGDVDSLYQAWRVWCAEQGIDRVATKQVFGTELGHAVDGLTTRQRPRPSRARFYVGIGLRHDWHALARVASHCSPGLPRAA